MEHLLFQVHFLDGAFDRIADTNNAAELAIVEDRYMQGSQSYGISLIA